MDKLLSTLLSPIIHHPWFAKVAFPVCGAAWVTTQLTNGSDPASVAGKAHQVAYAVMGLCTMLGILSPGVPKPFPADAPLAPAFDPTGANESSSKR